VSRGRRRFIACDSVRMRALLSGRDFQLRYTIARITRLVLGLDPTAPDATQVRVEWPIVARPGKPVVADLVLERGDGTPCEIVECKEHEAYLDPRSVRKFLDDVVRLRAVVPAGTRYRFVSNARFLRDGTDFDAEEGRAKTFPGEAEAADLIWECGTDSKQALTAEVVFHFARRAEHAHLYYAQLYARLAAQMAKRIRKRDALRRDLNELHRYLFGVAGDRPLEPSDETSFALDELRRVLGNPSIIVAAATTARAAIESLRQPLFEESTVSLEDVFVEPLATVSTPSRTGGGMSRFDEPALALLFRWLAESRETKASTPRLIGGSAWLRPLLFLGDFGSGKSSLLTIFAHRLIEAKSPVTPLFIPLRVLVSTGSQVALIDALRRYVQSEYEVDLADKKNHGRYLLLCDGFDELNLFFTRDDDRKWVEECYRQLEEIGRSSLVVISSRPVLFMGSDRVRSEHPTIVLQPLGDEQIRRWCDQFRAKTPAAAGFTFELLAERELVEVARSPLVLYMLSRIFATRPEMLMQRGRYTRADVYRLFVDWTEQGGYVADGKKHAVPRNYRQMLQDVAWFLFQSGEGVLPQSDIIRRLQETYGTHVDKVPVAPNLLVAHMLRPVRRDGIADDQLVEFSHQSFREYLVAERIWRVLEPVRRGAPLEPATWSALSGKLLTPAKMDLLSEIIADAPLEEVTALRTALREPSNIHSYWAKWSRPLWDDLAAGRVQLDETRSRVETLPPRAFVQAVLAYLIRIKCTRRMLELTGQAELPPETELLANLLHFRATFPDRGIVADAQMLLEAHLGGLRLHGGSLARCELEDVELQDVVLSNVLLTGASLVGATIERSQFRNCDFTRAELRDLYISESTFTDCFFVGAELELEGEDCRFIRANFDRARLSFVALKRATFTGCTWNGARLESAEGGKLIGCKLDAAAEDFFRRAGIEIVPARIRRPI
jgi:hypothetical protein